MSISNHPLTKESSSMILLRFLLKNLKRVEPALVKNPDKTHAPSE